MYVIILGCGRVGSELAKLLSSEGHNVVVIDRNPTSFERLGRTFNGITLVGNGFDIDSLKAAGITQAQAFCAVTNGDNTNLVAAQVAKKIFNVPKVIVRVYDPNRANIYKALGLDVISGTILFAAMIRDKVVESKFSSYLIESGELGVLEIEVNKDLQGKAVGEINVPGELIVTIVKRVEGIIIPELNTNVKIGDTLLAVIKIASLDRIRKRFGIV
ncbi:MAG: TrkA family potassium uptake protein [Candidatus Omnitrophica bacterium]|nr:TrkA family potassium uptake protein [Candidatus Omnitrophota bacterium]MBU4488698.1 TrkA family potassium uptake protein [Candidatus Omnitrophota bacterium]MCG2705727.1 TrkA family potassium uptake protein [Candidatus Omnitrophota bacterium]